MSKLEKLIKELCPEGVEYRKIKDKYTRLKGTAITAGKMKQIHRADGDIRIFAGGKTVIDTYEKDINNANITRTPSVLVQSRGIIDVIFYDEPFTFKNEMWAYTAENIVFVKYLYYVLKNNIQGFRNLALGMGSMPQISLKVTEEFKIPIPPLPVQEEIVRILDNFTKLTTGLTARLTAELAARQKQYEYYRDKLLTFGDEVEWKTLGEIGELIRGSGLKKSDFLDEGYPCIHYGQIHTYYGTSANQTISFVSPELSKRLKKAKGGDVLIAGVSENVEDICKPLAWLGDDVCIGGDMFALRHSQNTKYITYLLQTTDFGRYKERFAHGAKVTRLRQDKLLSYKIPVPSLAEQERIVAILDKFDALVNDINIGIPAEIEARQKQYEYYRDKLLQFKELSEV